MLITLKKMSFIYLANRSIETNARRFIAVSPPTVTRYASKLRPISPNAQPTERGMALGYTVAMCMVETFNLIKRRVQNQSHDRLSNFCIGDLGRDNLHG